METIAMTSRDQQRAHVLTRLVAGELEVGEAALLMGLSERQAWRLRRAFLDPPRTPRLKVKPQDVALMRLSAAEKYLLGRCDGTRDLRQIVKLAPEEVRVNERLAGLYQQLGLMSDAMGQLQFIAAAHERAVDNSKLTEVLQRMVELDPENIASSIKLGELFARAPPCDPCWEQADLGFEAEGGMRGRARRRWVTPSATPMT
jgi:hypothetical protein